MKVIDARGLECPKPVLKTKEEVDNGSAVIKIYVDNEVAVSNVTRFLEGQGFSVKREGAVPNVTIEGDKNAGVELVKKTQPKPGAALSMLILRDKIGADSDGLGEALMKAFLGTIVQNGDIPGVVALMNEGVKMAITGKSTADTLKELEQKGVSLLICGTCVKHFGIAAEEIKIGVISNMFEITEAVFSASKPVVIG